MWVRSKYASELAVLSAWLAVFVPWNVAYHTQTWIRGDPSIEGSVFFFRFPFFELQLRSGSVVEAVGREAIEFDVSNLEADAYPGTALFGEFFVTTPPQSLAFYESTLWQASLLWMVASLAFAFAFALSIALYLREEEVVEFLPVSQVRLMGALLGLGALGTGGASVLYYVERDVVGLPIPVGVLVVGALAIVLLQTEEIPDDEAEESANQTS